MSTTNNPNPWFKFYFRDWMDSESIMDMSLAAEGLYFRCLSLQAMKGSIPADMRKLAQFLRRDYDEVAQYWPEVQPHFLEEEIDGQRRFYNVKLRDLIEDAARYSKGAKKGHEVRKEKSQPNPKMGFSTPTPEIPTDTRARTRAHAHSASVSVSVSDSLSDLESDNESDQDAPPAPPPAQRNPAKARAAVLFHERFWPEWPAPRKDKQAAEKAWMRICPDEAMCNVIMAGLHRSRQSEQWRVRKVIPSPATWLNNARWNDEADVDDAPASAEAAQPVAPDELPEFSPLSPGLWDEALHALNLEDPDGVECWLRTIKPLGYAGDEIWLGAVGQMQRNWVAANYREVLCKHLKTESIRVVVLRDQEDAA